MMKKLWQKNKSISILLSVLLLMVIPPLIVMAGQHFLLLKNEAIDNKRTRMNIVL